MTPPAALSAAATALTAALETGASQRTIARDRIQAAFEQACPGAARTARARPMLAALLDELAESQHITLPRSQSGWDAGRPPLPEWARLPAQAPASPRQRASSFPWRPELSWAVDARLTASQIEDLRRVNRWLRDTAAQPREPVPLRERSFEIFGDEKHLDRLAATSLFGPGRLSVGLLGAVRTPPPLAHTRVGDGPLLAVAENSATYATLVTLLRTRPGAVGHVAFGSGRAFEASCAGIGEIPGVSAVRYYGDLDADGLAIPARASITSAEAGLPEIAPAAGLYQLLLAQPPQPGGAAADPQRAAALAAWLPASLQEQAASLLASGHRIPQEATGRLLLRVSLEWRSDLDVP